MLKNMNIYFIFIIQLFLIGCIALYKIPSSPKQNFILDYKYNEPFFEKSNTPVILLTAVINEKNDLFLDLDDSDSKAIHTNSIFRTSIKSLTRDLERIIKKNNIAQFFKKDINKRFKTILRNKGFTNIVSKEGILENLDYKNISNSKLVIQPTVTITQKVSVPIAESEIVGQRGEYPTYVRRSPLVSNYEISIDMKFYEPLTEKLVSFISQNNKKSISEKFDFFVDTYWSRDGIKLIVYQGIAFNNYEEKYGASLSSKYQSLLQPIDDKITLEFVEKANSDCVDIQNKYIPTKANVVSNFSYKPTENYKKLENVYAVMIKNGIDNYSTDNEIFNKFDSALNEQIVKIFKLRGVDILDRVTDTDNMVYSDKKKSYFAIKVNNTINLNNGLLKDEEKLGKLIITNDDININGEITISIFETMTKEKLLEKSIVFNDKIGNVYQVEFDNIGQKVKLFDNSDEKLLNLLDNNFDKICNDIWTILSPKSISEIKSNVNEIRRKVGFPILN